MEVLIRTLQEATPPEVTLDGEDRDVDNVLSQGCRVIMEAADDCTKQEPATEQLWDETQPREETAGYQRL